MKLLLITLFCLVGLGLSYNPEEYVAMIQQLEKNPKLIAEFQEHLDYLQSIEPNYWDYNPFESNNLTFDCNGDQLKPSENVPTSVHELRPGDVQVVGAMGDSITAACGGNAKTIIGLLLEYRGHSWSMGGKDSLEKVFTMPNILKKFNPNLKGFNRLIDLSIVALTKKGVGFNVAVSGEKSNHMPRQAKDLLERMRSSKKIDFNNDWKMITLFIGGNDLCAICKDPEYYSPENYVKYIQEALDLLHKELPRAFINLVQVVNITEVKDMNRGICKLLHRTECPCGAFPEDKAAEKLLQDYISGYHDLTRKMVDSGRYDTREDFTVVLQPFFEDFVPPRLENLDIDFSYLAPDCFHFSPKGTALSAKGLWNNMLQPVGQKSRTISIDEKILCPTKEHPYLFTSKNSN